MDQTFTPDALAAATRGLNDSPYAQKLTDIQFGFQRIYYTLQEGTESALVVHLLPDGKHDVTTVGTPSAEARATMQNVCASIARHWHADLAHIKLCVGALRASLDCLY